ncbi:TPA: hypothetical protein DIC38_02170 [Candidatus Nomurabacteria bacterium]|nr:MAG: hypothetical protein O210_OD1C00001G0296 [Parcubacteria bacterium RAAC4_OD1_1]HCY26463.1 hypothetical protein [Candidatus Nomurabacteria bacterium]
MWTTIIVLFLITIVAITISIKKVPEKYWLQLSKLGKRLEGEYKDEGWRILLFYPFYMSGTLLSKERKNLEIACEKEMTPDKVDSDISVHITYVINPEYGVNFLNSGGFEGVEKQLTGKVKERIREWCMSEEEGPANWRELQKSKLEAVHVIIKKLLGDSTDPIPEYAQDVPTTIWMRYFQRPRPTKPLEYEEKWFENDWEMVTNVLSGLSDDQINELKEKVETRRKEITDLSTGSGKKFSEDLGVIIQRINIGSINVDPKVAEQATKEEREKLEKAGEVIEIRHIIEMAKEIAEKTGVSPEQAFEILQTERNKVVKKIDEKKISISNDTKSALEQVSENISKIFKS